MSDDFSDVVTADVIGGCDVLTVQFTLNPDEMRRVLIASGLPLRVRDAQRELAAYKQAVAERTEYAFKNKEDATPFRIDAFIQGRVDELLAANA